VVAGQQLDLADDLLEEARVTFVMPQLRNHALRDHRGRASGRARRLRLELQVQQAVDSVRGDIADGHQRTDIGGARTLRGGVAGHRGGDRVRHLGQHVFLDELTQWQSDEVFGRQPEQGFDVRRHVADAPVGARAGDQVAMGLDGTGQVNWRPQAGIQIDGSRSLGFVHGVCGSPARWKAASAVANADSAAARQRSACWVSSLAAASGGSGSVDDGLRAEWCGKPAPPAVPCRSVSACRANWRAPTEAPATTYAQPSRPASSAGIGTAMSGSVPGDMPNTRMSSRSEEHTSELQSRENLVCRLLLEK